MATTERLNIKEGEDLIALKELERRDISCKPQCVKINGYDVVGNGMGGRQQLLLPIAL